MDGSVGGEPGAALRQPITADAGSHYRSNPVATVGDRPRVLGSQGTSALSNEHQHNPYIRHGHRVVPWVVSLRLLIGRCASPGVGADPCPTGAAVGMGCGRVVVRTHLYRVVQRHTVLTSRSGTSGSFPDSKERCHHSWLSQRRSTRCAGVSRPAHARGPIRIVPRNESLQANVVSVWAGGGPVCGAQITRSTGGPSPACGPARKGEEAIVRQLTGVVAAMELGPTGETPRPHRGRQPPPRRGSRRTHAAIVTLRSQGRSHRRGPCRRMPSGRPVPSRAGMSLPRPVGPRPSRCAQRGRQRAPRGTRLPRTA